MKKVLVTGADGFIGSHLVELLVKEGFQVKALCQYNSYNSWGWLEDTECTDDVDIVTGDVRDPHYCMQLTKNIDIVFHLAALIAIPYSYAAPDSYIDTNVRGTLNICQAALKNSVGRVVQTSTSEVYGTAQYVPIDEFHPTQPQSPYSASKIGADAVAMSFYNSFDLPITIARPFNTYGPRQSARAVIPTIITQIASGATQIKLGHVNTTRDFTYVTDTCRGLLALVNSQKSIGETVNIGSNFEVTILETFNKLKQIMKSDVELVIEEKRQRPAKSEVYRLWCDNTKLVSLTEFSPKIDMPQGLRNTVRWFTQPHNLAKFKSRLYNV